MRTWKSMKQDSGQTQNKEPQEGGRGRKGSREGRREHRGCGTSSDLDLLCALKQGLSLLTASVSCDHSAGLTEASLTKCTRCSRGWEYVQDLTHSCLCV